ncbi:hypothetical protein K1T71_007388 [Dendrolimus kikuchii]|uniref:Uncharacterized protein n=1 Tax=Dendrolimus kikuchii TaxID=765133 RepID=A0ACC1D0C1_9NEOP|nr:hypothetical protein K1T71_007388 [Dendrolimus kikuchii]
MVDRGQIHCSTAHNTTNRIRLSRKSRAKTNMGWPILILAILATVAHGQQQETCLSVEEHPYFLFATKTAYVFATQSSPTTKLQDVPGCEPIAFWLLSRHGSHNPETEEISLQNLMDLKRTIATNWKNNQRFICPSDFNLLNSWEWNNATRPGDLTTEGYMTTERLAQSWKQKYPGLLDGNRLNYLFKYADDERSVNTFRAFTEGLFGAQAESYDIPREHDEQTLRPYKFCKAWLKDVEQNNETLTQKAIFESKREYLEMITNISKRLGSQYNYEEQFIQNMYDMCRYEKAKDVSKISPWCAAFTRQDLQRLEYAEDLETYYKYGYGTEINQKIGCTHLKDMMEFFKKHSENDTPQQPRAVIQLTEAPTLMMVMAAMGIRKDQVPLTGDNYHTNSVQARKWSTSSMVPFTGNIAAVLYKCTPNGNFQVKEQYQVLFMENEKPMYIEECRVGLCAWSQVKAKYEELINQCDLSICNAATKLNSLFGYSLAVVMIAVRYF